MLTVQKGRGFAGSKLAVNQNLGAKLLYIVDNRMYKYECLSMFSLVNNKTLYSDALVLLLRLS